MYASQDSIYCGATSESRDLERDRLDSMQATCFDVSVLQVSARGAHGEPSLRL